MLSCLKLFHILYSPSIFTFLFPNFISIGVRSTFDIFAVKTYRNYIILLNNSFRFIEPLLIEVEVLSQCYLLYDIIFILTTFILQQFCDTKVQNQTLLIEILLAVNIYEQFLLSVLLELIHGLRIEALKTCQAPCPRNLWYFQGNISYAS